MGVLELYHAFKTKLAGRLNPTKKLMHTYAVYGEDFHIKVLRKTGIEQLSWSCGFASRVTTNKITRSNHWMIGHMSGCLKMHH